MKGKKSAKMRRRTAAIWLTGVLFAAYAVYNVFIIVRDGKSLSPEGIFISAVVALLFVVLAGFVLSGKAITGKLRKNKRFLMIRRTVFIVALLAVFLLKLRMAGQVAAFLDFSKPQTVLYGASYLMTQTALLILLIYYIIFRIQLPRRLSVSILLLLFAVILFAGSLALEAILFFVYGIGLEANVLRTVVMRPVFYLGFIGLTVYFLISAQFSAKPKKAKGTDSEEKHETK